MLSLCLAAYDARVEELGSLHAQLTAAEECRAAAESALAAASAWAQAEDALQRLAGAGDEPVVHACGPCHQARAARTASAARASMPPKATATGTVLAVFFIAAWAGLQSGRLQRTGSAPVLRELVPFALPGALVACGRQQELCAGRAHCCSHDEIPCPVQSPSTRRQPPGSRDARWRLASSPAGCLQVSRAPVAVLAVGAAGQLRAAGACSSNLLRSASFEAVSCTYHSSAGVPSLGAFSSCASMSSPTAFLPLLGPSGWQRCGLPLRLRRAGLCTKVGWAWCLSVAVLAMQLPQSNKLPPPLRAHLQEPLTQRA